MENKYEKVYKLRKEDFIPITGFKRHLGRCLREIDFGQLSGYKEEDEFKSQSFARGVVLTFYNATIIAGAGIAISGLIQLLSK